MATPAPDVQDESVDTVVRGTFNPAIISPGWLLANGLISEREHDDNKPDPIIPKLAVFEVAGLRFQVTTDALAVTSENPTTFERVRDMVVGILEILRHTPVNMLGINHSYHAKLPSAYAWHRVGDALAPKDAWDAVLVLPGMRDVTVMGVRPDLYGGAVHVSVQPSALVEQGVFVGLNDHFLLTEVEHQPESRDDFFPPTGEGPVPVPKQSPDLIPLATGILKKEWAASQERAEAVLRLVWGLGVRE